jgi:hypothetical protein
MVAAALPANPSRVQTLMRIHHHGNEASTVVTEANRLRASAFMMLPCLLNGEKEKQRKEKRRKSASRNFFSFSLFLFFSFSHSLFLFSLFHAQTAGNIALFLLLCRGSN